jgi:putative flippase GtrA
VNLVFMRLLVGTLHIPYLIANLAAIAAGSLANFLLTEFFVFRSARKRTTSAGSGLR